MTDKNEEPENTCPICEGTKLHLGHPCSFCNGTGEWTEAAQSFMENHICQCIAWGRKFCPICKKPCHHNTPNSPKQKIDPGFGGTSTATSYNFDTQLSNQTGNDSQPLEVVIPA